MAFEAVELSELLGQIYDCVLAPKGWSAVLERVSARLGACSATMNYHDHASNRATLAVEWATDPAYSASYVTTYARVNPLVPAFALTCAAAETRVIADVMSRDEFRRTRFYREWCAPQGYGELLLGMLARNHSVDGVVGFTRDEQAGEFTSEHAADLRLLLPHLARSAAISGVLIGAERERAGLSTLVERLSVVAVLVDEHRNIVTRNEAARDALQRKDVMRDDGGVLRFVSRDAERALETAARGLSRTPAAVPLTTDAGPRLITLLPPSKASGALTIVLVTTPEPDLPPPAAPLMRAFGLTPSETTLLMLLLQGLSLQDAAAELQVAETTAKTHLKHLFEKTSTTKQAHLIQAAMRVMPPLRPEPPPKP